ncbi:heme/hemin ABC transporter substrate-binding protein [Williamsia muralis]|uniref:heme/hemin ABC transporter substrate-binding protein n=1 Tax=Williamsia marianensis TaxID=85044 RepID=UPI003F5CC854
MVNNRSSGGRTAPVVAALIMIVGVLMGACSTAPITDSANSSTVQDDILRSGPQTAALEGPDVEPIADNPVPVLPVTVDSVGGGRVTVADASRIIAIDRSGTLANIVFSLGLGERVVARDRSTVIPGAGQLPLITDSGHSVNIEAVLAADPSVVLIDESVNPPGTIDQLRAAGITVVVFAKDRTIASTGPLINAVAGALGVPDQGRALAARTDAEIESARASVPERAHGSKMAFLYLRGERFKLLAGPGSGADDLIEAIGGVDAGTAAGLTSSFTTVDAEAMINADPAVILVMTQGAESVGGIDKVLQLPGLAQTDAGRNRRVVQMDQAEILTFGPDTGRVLAALAEAIYV